MTTKEQLENGCGFQDNSWKSSLCKKDNLCSECRNSLDYYNKGHQEARKELIEEIEKMLNNLKVRLILTLNTNSECKCTKSTDKYGNIAGLIINDSIKQLKELENKTK